MQAAIGRVLIRGLSLFFLAVTPPAIAQDDWPLWQAFSNRFIQADGRVLADESEQRYSTSEGQAYALFFALVSNDRAAFDRLLVWTRENMAGGDLGARLPAWQWGKRPDGSWGVVDQNSASDADSWLAYTLIEAGRLWNAPRYTAQGNLLLANIRVHLIRNLPGIGEMLLPAASGFELESGGSRLNPSYYPVQLLRVFAKADPSGPWKRLIANNLKMLQSASANGYVPDWVSYVSGHGYLPDSKSGATGTHDAIRVYLWWGMLSGQDPMSARLKKVISGMNRLIPKYAITPPLSIETQTGKLSGISPPSFSAALLPYFSSMKNTLALRLQNERLISQTTGALIGSEPRYYDQALTLFGQGWMDKRFSFSSQGQLVVKWKELCSAKN